MLPNYVVRNADNTYELPAGIDPAGIESPVHAGPTFGLDMLQMLAREENFHVGELPAIMGETLWEFDNFLKRLLLSPLSITDPRIPLEMLSSCARPVIEINIEKKPPLGVCIHEGCQVPVDRAHMNLCHEHK